VICFSKLILPLFTQFSTKTQFFLKLDFISFFCYIEIEQYCSITKKVQLSKVNGQKKMGNKRRKRKTLKKENLKKISQTPLVPPTEEKIKKPGNKDKRYGRRPCVKSLLALYAQR